MTSFRLSRRTLLRGTGAAVALPLLDAMLDSNGLALAQGAPLPKRFGLFFFGNGIHIPRWVPDYFAWNGKGGTQVTWTLSDALNNPRLEAVKRYLNLATGFGLKNQNLRGHHSAAAGILSGASEMEISLPGIPYASKLRAPSVDQIAAAHIGTTTKFPSLQVVVSKAGINGLEGPTLEFVSHKDSNTPLPAESSPVRLFNRLFGTFTPPTTTPTGPDPATQLRASVLDLVSEDAKRVMRKLGADDRRRLDQHLTGISELRRQLLALPPTSVGSSCVKPAPPTLPNNEGLGDEKLGEVASALSGVLAMAMACDLTRVFSFQFTPAVASTVFREIGLTGGSHDISHDPGQIDSQHKMVRHSMLQYGQLLEKMMLTPDGPGRNLLDSSVVLATSDCSDGSAHGHYDYPLLLGGSAGGYFKSPGVHYRSPNFENPSNLLLSCLRAVGANVAQFGVDTPNSPSASSTLCREVMA